MTRFECPVAKLTKEALKNKKKQKKKYRQPMACREVSNSKSQLSLRISI